MTDGLEGWMTVSRIVAAADDGLPGRIRDGASPARSLLRASIWNRWNIECEAVAISRAAMSRTQRSTSLKLQGCPRYQQPGRGGAPHSPGLVVTAQRAHQMGTPVQAGASSCRSSYIISHQLKVVHLFFWILAESQEFAGNITPHVQIGPGTWLQS